jgi:hypothetical protein
LPLWNLPLGIYRHHRVTHVTKRIGVIGVIRDVALNMVQQGRLYSLLCADIGVERVDRWLPSSSPVNSRVTISEATECLWLSAQDKGLAEVIEILRTSLQLLG